jgi:Thiopurine S-methyltransferase (TPMT)
LIPGCGEDYRTINAFRSAGHHVIAIDFSPVAVESITKAVPEMSEAIILGDFFSYNFESESFDFVYERTFLCSLPPSLWQQYGARVAQLLRPEGTLAGFFFYGEEPNPPPFPLTELEASETLGRWFDLRKSEPVTDSLSIFGGKEKWQEWQRRER